MNIKYIAISLTAILPLCVSTTASAEWNTEKAVAAQGGVDKVASPESDKKNQQEDDEVAALAAGLNLPSKAVMFAKTPKERKVKKQQSMKKKHYKTSSRSGAVIDKGMTFSTGSATLNPYTKKRVSTLAKVYNGNSGIIKQIIITGHTDTIGNNNSNLTLSNARATSVKQELTLQGVPANLIVAKGYGESNLLPNVAGASAANRRVEYSVVKK